MEDRWLYGWAVGYAAVGAASLLVPLYALTLPGGGPALVGLLAATAAFAGVPGALLWGRLAARTNRRRPFVLVALGLTAAALAVVPFVESAAALLAANAALWFVVSAAAPVLNLVIVDGAPPERWDARIARLNAFQGYGWVAGLVAGTAWTAVAPGILGPAPARQLLFWLLAATAALGFALVRTWYPQAVELTDASFRREYREHVPRGWGAGRYLQTAVYGPSRLYWALVTLRPAGLGRFRTPLWRYFGALTLFTCGFAIFWGPMPAYLGDGLGLADGPVFVLFLLANGGSAVTYARVGDVASTYGPVPSQAAALAARVVVFPALGVVGASALGLTVLAVGFLLMGVTWAVIAVTTTGIVARLAPEHERGDALGLQVALAGLANGVGSALGGLLAAGIGYALTFALAGAVVLVGAVVLAVGADRSLAPRPVT